MSNRMFRKAMELDTAKERKSAIEEILWEIEEWEPYLEDVAALNAVLQSVKVEVSDTGMTATALVEYTINNGGTCDFKDDCTEHAWVTFKISKDGNSIESVDYLEADQDII